MNAKEVIEKLRLTFNELVNQGASPVALLDASLKDGTAIQVTDMAVGGIVTIAGQPAPVGEYELSDGTYLIVGDNGAIMEIKTETAPVPAPAPAPSQMEDMTAKFSAFENTYNEKFSSYEVKLSAYESKISDLENRLNSTIQGIQTLMNLTQSIADAPTGVPDQAVKSSNNFVEEKKMSYDILFS